MTVYNLNLGIGWASSGVEYAQAYRANMFRRVGIPAKFIFTDMITYEHIEHMTKNIGLLDEEVIWLYTYFTDFKMAPVSYTLSQLEESFSWKNYSKKHEDKVVIYNIEGEQVFLRAYLVDKDKDLVHRVEYVSDGCLIRKDYFSYAKMFTEYYAPKDGAAYLYHRTHYNVNGSVAYEEIIDGDDNIVYSFPDKIFCSKEDFISYFIQCLKLTKDDIFIIDRSTGQGQSVFENCGEAKVGSIIHADHFSDNCTDDNTILWNNYYEYEFMNNDLIDFFVAATEPQTKLVKEQFKKYLGVDLNCVTIPVGSLDELKRPSKPRKKHGLITASRLASEKHIDWIIRAVAEVRKEVDDVTLDIYGSGGEKEDLEKLIEELNCGDYVRLMGHHNLDDVYCQYESYVAASTSEGFGLTLMEAVGSGLPMVGFDVRYGNQNFIDHGVNGYLIPKTKEMRTQDLVAGLTDAIYKLLTEADIESFSEASYKIAERYLTSNVENMWKELVDSLHDTVVR